MVSKELKVSALKDGTVIDHIPATSLFKVINILNLELCSDMITFGTNLESKKHGLKSIIKISGNYFHDDEINKIALVAPKACLNTIKNYQVVEKRYVSLPEQLEGIVKCFNPKCITNHESIKTRFKVLQNSPVRLRCAYCEKVTNQEELVII